MRPHKPISALEQIVMMAVLRLEDGAYGTSLLRELSERGGRNVSPGALFATVDRLEGKGLVVSRLGDPTPGRGGKRKRFARLTPEGMAALREAHGAWIRMSEGLEEVLQR